MLKFWAPAKINLALHVTGQRADGYHLIDTLVTFADFGDELSFAASQKDELLLSGPFAGQLEGQDPQSNLVSKARDLLRDLAQGRPCPPVAIHLTKNLPVASGLGGGSSDAAAALRGLCEFWGLSRPDLGKAALALGADVPMCLAGTPLRAGGIGEELALVPKFPALNLVLANPGVAVSTPQIFASLTKKDNRPLSPLPNLSSIHAAVEWLAAQRNDLQAAAVQAQPAISECLFALKSSGAMLARMSGSGATCFGIFASHDSAARAVKAISGARHDWFAAAVTCGGAK